MKTSPFIPAKIEPEQLQHPLFEKAGVSVWILRLDRLHPVVSGNKWLKLKGWIDASKTDNAKGILTLGGPWSNHVHAAAAWCHLNGMVFSAIIRGNPDTPTAMLQDVMNWRGRITWVNRTSFHEMHHWQKLAMMERLIWIPMGGDGQPGVSGVSNYFDQFSAWHFDEIWCAAGTGTTVKGIAQSAIGAADIVAFIPGIHDEEAESSIIQTVRSAKRSVRIHRLPNDRFGKTSNEVIMQMNQWWEATGMPTDGIYTGKMIAAFLEHLQQAAVPLHRKILLVHTGGLQGNRSMEPGTLKFMG